MDVLRKVDRIACEDTRQTQKLLNHYQISTPTISCHLHNERERATELLEALKAGGRIAVVSDAGMPGISDPGTWLVAEAIAAGVTVIPIPGANAALSALVTSGLPTNEFQFIGFLPEKAGARRTRLEELAAGRAKGEAASWRHASPATSGIRRSGKFWRTSNMRGKLKEDMQKLLPGNTSLRHLKGRLHYA